MENQNIAFTLGVGVLAALALFVLFYKVLKRPGKLASLLTFLVVQTIYLPIAVLHWASLDVFAIHFAFFTMAAVLPGIIVGNKRGAAGESGRFHWGPGIMIGFFMILVIVDSTIITLANSGASADFIARFLPAPRQDIAQRQREYRQNQEAQTPPQQKGGQVVSAFPGTVSNDYQKKYTQYNNYIAQLRTQRERGWQVADGWLEKPQPNKVSMFRIHVTDKAGQAVTGGQVQVSFLRPSAKALDVTVELPEAAPGFYGQALALPASGAWDIAMTIKRGDDIHEVKGGTWIGEQR
ncbi:MAG: hypothetical protein BWK73_26545 [Thiothrix lacustris]|uniref:Nitrogen fixation protein FixH n=1 Tax=Thiothrix lacustris TaxID=525917 RepID=A0A1Y1QL02_9GAMM|nr:MAG: hypothetical protein BWK73_26545 [Thiothrix lacustris]